MEVVHTFLIVFGTETGRRSDYAADPWNGTQSSYNEASIFLVFSAAEPLDKRFLRPLGFLSLAMSRRQYRGLSRSAITGIFVARAT
jgi:hypothetical protein